MSEVKKADKREDGKKFGWGAPVTVGIGAAAIAAALLFQKCGTQRGPDVNCPPAPVCPAVVQDDPNRCQPERGEHDPLSPNWDPAHCGYCGDDIRQPFEISSRDQRASQPQAAGQPRLIVCDIDFHCGNGQRDNNTQYAAMVPPRADGGVWAFGTVPITESCRQNDSNYCAEDCGGAQPAESGGRRTQRTPDRDRPERPNPQPTGRVGPCDSGISTAMFSSRARDQLTGNAGAIRNAVGAQGSQAVTVRVSVTIGPDGRPTVTGASASCAGCSGGNVANYVNLAGLSTTAPGDSCSSGFTVNIPPG